MYERHYIELFYIPRQIPREWNTSNVLRACAQVVLTLAASTTNTGAEPSEPTGGQGLDSQLLGVMLQNFLPLAQTAEERGHLMTSLLSTAQSGDDTEVARMFFDHFHHVVCVEALVVQW